MSKNPEIVSPEQLEEFPWQTRSIAWIEKLDGIFKGATRDVITPETHPGTVCETAVYYFPEDNQDFSNRLTTLTVKRTRIARNLLFRVYGDSFHGGTHVWYESHSVAKLRFDPEAETVEFIIDSEVGVPQPLGLRASSTG